MIAAFALLIVTLVPAGAREAYVPPARDSVHAVVAEHGLVVAQEKLAARIGADILKQGGNAVDAAVATAFAMAVTYPRAGNIGGGGFMVIHLAGRNEDVAIDYREMAPAAITRDIFLGADGKPDPVKSRDSALGIGVPGTVAGLALTIPLWQDVQNFPIFRQSNAPRGFDRAANIITLDIARLRAHRDSSAAVHAADMAACDANHGRLDGHSDDRFRFLDGATNRADREIEVHDLALAPAFRFRRAKRREFHAAVVIHFADQRAGFRAADIKRNDVPFFLRQIRSL